MDQHIADSSEPRRDMGNEVEAGGGAGSPWQVLRARLLVLGWLQDTVEGIDGLWSPHKAVFVHADHVNDPNLRESLLRGLERQVVGIQRRPAQNVPEGWEAGVSEDFKQLVDGIKGVGL